jgi:release factor glutamine methyltransferase
VRIETLIWTAGSLLAWAGAYLQKYEVSSPRLSAELILGKILGKSRLELYLNYDQPLNQEELAAFKSLLIRRRQHEPVAYLTGVREFYSLELQVGPGVLIPRPESELLVEEGLKALARSEEKPKILDLCTGSGAVALALAANLPQAEIWAADISEQALSYARNNAQKLQLAGVNFLRGDLWSPLLSRGIFFDLITANPPYVSPGEWRELDPEVRNYEPRLALLGGDDGFALIQAILQGARAFLRPLAILLLEIAPAQEERARAEAKRAGIYEEISILPDLAGQARVLKCLRSDYGSASH